VPHESKSSFIKQATNLKPGENIEELLAKELLHWITLTFEIRKEDIVQRRARYNTTIEEINRKVAKNEEISKSLKESMEKAKDEAIKKWESDKKPL